MRLNPFSRGAPVVSVIRLSGVIGPASRFARNLDDASVAPLIERAIKPSRLAAIALVVNSPGGSPVQSRLIASRLRDAAEKKGTPILAFCEDVAASGGYWLACAADEIHADPASIVGSIGVISAGFGFTDAIAKLGVERRVTTAGENKARLDPFRAVDPDDQAWLENLQTRIHRQFTDFVEERRRGKLKDGAGGRIFSGEAFIGEEALELGLIDGHERLRPYFKARFGENVKLDVVTRRKGFLERMGGGVSAPHESGWARGAGDAAVSRLIDEVNSAAHWGRYGL